MQSLLDPGYWLIEGRLLGISYPASEPALRSLRQRGINLVVNLHEHAHPHERLESCGVTSVHIPIADFQAPTQEQIDLALGAIDDALGRGEGIAVHCGAGLGRTGTILACYLVSAGDSAHTAIQRIRELRPGSIETGEQVEAIKTFERRLRGVAGNA